MSNQRVCADRHLELIYSQTRDISGEILSNKFIPGGEFKCQIFVFMARVLLIKVALGKITCAVIVVLTPENTENFSL